MDTIIISGGNLKKEFFDKVNREYKFDNIIACDRGLETLYKCNVKPNYIIGDFDSVNENVFKKYKENKEIQIISLNPEKDYTDTHMALKLAIELKSNNIKILGAIGSRIDHTLANINILKEALDENVKCEIISENNSITLINSKTIIKKDNEYKYISLIPLTTKVSEVTLTGFKYPLKKATMVIGESIGVSNEQIEKEAKIEIGEGILILLKTKD